MTFSLSDERYAVETRFIREVVRPTDYARLPAAPPFLVGVMNLRGEVLALMDLRTFFDLPARGLTDRSRVLVVGDGRAEFGVLADAAQEVALLPVTKLQAAGPPGRGRPRVRAWRNHRGADRARRGGVLQDGRLFIDQGEEAGG